MKLHLNKTLLAAVLACFAAGASYGVSVSSQASWSVSGLVSAIDAAAEGEPVTKTWDGTTYTFTKSDGMLNVSGYSLSGNSLSNVTFQVDADSLKVLTSGTVALVNADFANNDWGISVIGASDGAKFSGDNITDNNHDWNNNVAPRTAVSQLKDDGIVSAYFCKNSNPGVSLTNGLQSATSQNDTIYFGGGLHWTNAGNLNSVNFNTTYVTALIQTADSYQSGADSYTVTNADGTWTKSYTSATNGVSDTTVGATMVTGGRLQVTSAEAGKVSTNGGDIIVGGSGQLFLQTWGSSADIVLDNDIYLGGSTHGEANTHGILRFGTDGGHSVALNGNVTLIEDSTMGSNGNGDAVDINGKVSGNYTLTIVGGNEVNLNGGVDLGTLQMNNGTALDITAEAATIGTFRNSGSATVTVTGTSLTISELYAGTTGALTTGEGGSIVFGADATIDVANLTKEGSVDYTADGFIQESYRVTASGVNATITGDNIALVNGSLSLGSGTWNDGVVSMGDAIYNVATTKSYSDYQAAATEAGKTAVSILVQADGTYRATNLSQTIAITGTGTLEAAWGSRAKADTSGNNIKDAAANFTGDVIIKSGTGWVVNKDYDFASVTVESGAQFGIVGSSANYAGNVTISGTGRGTSPTDTDQGALCFGDGGTLTGNVTIKGEKASLATWGETGNITANITSEQSGGAELVTTNTRGSGSTVINVGGGLSGISKVTTGANTNIKVAGSITGFGDTFTKDGAGTLTLSGNNTKLSSGTLEIAGGMVDVTGSNNASGIFDKANTTIKVLGGGTLRIAHDSMGWNDGATAGTLILQGTDAATRACLVDNNGNGSNANTMSTAISLKGYTSITSTSGSVGILLHNATITAESVDNLISSNLKLNKATTMTVKADGELEIQGVVSGDNALSKNGAGNLTLTAANTASSTLNVNGGTVTLKDNGSWAGAIAVGADGTISIVSDTAKTTASAISGDGALATSGSGAKTFSDAVNVGSLTATGGDVTFNGDLTLNGKSSIAGNVSVKTATVNADLTVGGSATLVATTTGEGDEATTTPGSLTIADGVTLSTDNGKETVTNLASGTAATIEGAGKVSVETAGLTYTNADITVNAQANETVTTAATLSSSKLTVNGGTVETKVAENTTNDFNASAGSVAVNTGTADTATVGDLVVGTGKSVNFATEGGDAVTATVTNTATVAGTVNANVNVEGADDSNKATFTAESGAAVGGDLTINAGTGSLVLTTVNESGEGILTVDNTLTATLTSISLSAAAKSAINTAMATLGSSNTSVSIALAHVGGLSISGIDLSSGSAELSDDQLSQLGITKLANVTYTMSSVTTLAARGASSYLTIDGAYTGAPGTLTETSVVDGGVLVSGTNITLTVADSLAGVTGGFNVIVGDAAWADIVSGMAAAGGIYQNATITLTDGTNVFDWTGAGAVTLNGYEGTGTPGEYYVAYIPEPATATLSLLALAALAARRRRK